MALPVIVALAVVDEQHRFGVHQLSPRKAKPSMLVLHCERQSREPLSLRFSATWTFPSCAKNHRGTTNRHPDDLSRLQEVEDAVGRVIAEGKRAYWVCPLVEESEKIDLAAAQARFDNT